VRDTIISGALLNRGLGVHKRSAKPRRDPDEQTSAAAARPRNVRSMELGTYVGCALRAVVCPVTVYNASPQKVAQTTWRLSQASIMGKERPGCTSVIPLLSRLPRPCPM
jgi:hypothetical protein